MEGGGLRLNPHLHLLDDDFLYHIGYSRSDVEPLFRGVKFVVMGGSSGRMETFAKLAGEKLGEKVEDKTKTDRFVVYRIGAVIAISHGMGVPSITICLHEVIKALHYAGSGDAIVIRIGTSGGLKVDAGTVVVSNKAINAFLREEHEVVVRGEVQRRPAKLDQDLARDILECQDDKSFCTMLGGTLCTDDFYEGQCRMDGAFCKFDLEEKQAYLQKLCDAGVVNIEMESTAIASLCYEAGVKCAIVCVTLVERLKGDQVKLPPETYTQFQNRPQNLVIKFIESQLNTCT